MLTIGLLEGPLSSVSPNGPGFLFSVLFVLIGGWGLIRSWMEYLKPGGKTNVPLLNLVGISAIATVFIIVGIWGLLR